MDGSDKRGWVYPSMPRMAFWLLLWLGLGLPVSAQDQTISQMVHTAWTGRAGAPQAINALAQTPDGALWIGTFAGVFSFDGMKFAAFHPEAGSPPLPARTIQFLFVSHSGDLWVFGFPGATSPHTTGTCEGLRSRGGRTSRCPRSRPAGFAGHFVGCSE
jgi:Two component regulator propeller